ncbi:nucleotide-diphospho-sugar transferase [Aspergillus coremiiformis]|uniref:Nucleotide-diphospho-sugar transferase n=1 Tax=Aspergillus coremiiformis TaxID=138285 RepID=A0A5N6ZCH4_9EURO|nr:nucleotide-diphospho-sugar transferase [Aspergillus coremiiformis]
MLASRRTILVFLVVAFILFNAYYLGHKKPQKSIPPLSDRQAQLWQSLHSLLEQHVPDCPPPILHRSAGIPRFDAINETPRKSYIANADKIRQPMQAAHDGFVHAIRNLKIDHAYVPGTMGIVSSAGGTYLPTFVVSLLLLRRTGSTLPVELFMKDRTEYEPSICEVILPPLGVKCVVLSDIMAGQGGTGIEGFQIKSVAMLFSSFEKFLWLDADCVPLHDPTSILNSEPFTSTGLVTWPDFWANTAAPVYFNISRQPEPLSTVRQATEAGMLLVSKETHFLTLILAIYYNYYGPDYYYPLLDQGAPGAGDKDTFLHAATALNESFYSVSETVVDLGNVTPWNSQTAINAGYIQADPIQDYNLTSQGKWRVGDPTVAKPPRAFFIHAGDPEFNPGKDLLGEKLVGFDGNPTRLWTHPPGAMKRLGYDAEKAFWEETTAVACNSQFAFESWKSKSRLCEDTRAHWKAVFLKPDGKVPEFTNG